MEEVAAKYDVVTCIRYIRVHLCESTVKRRLRIIEEERKKLQLLNQQTSIYELRREIQEILEQRDAHLGSTGSRLSDDGNLCCDKGNTTTYTKDN